MLESKLGNAIIEAKKFNVALRAVNKYVQWDDNGLLQEQNELKVTLAEQDKLTLLKNNHELRKDLEKKRIHEAVIRQIDTIFKFEKKKNRDGKEKDVPTVQAAELLNDSAELLGLLLKAFGISTSQIRRYLDSLRKIKATTAYESFNPSDVLLLQVKIAYAAGRVRELNFLYEVMKPAIVKGSEGYYQFEQLLRFVEAIVAYHRYYRGED